MLTTEEKRNLVKHLGFTLVALLLQVLFVVAVFKLLPKPIAGILAGLGFVGVSGWILYAGIKDSKKRKTLSFYLAIIFLFASALPILFMSVTGVGKSIAHIALGSQSYFFVPLEKWHQLGSFVYLCLMFSTIMDAWLLLWSMQKNRK